MFFFFSSRRRHTRSTRDWSSDVCSSDLADLAKPPSDARMWTISSGNGASIHGHVWLWTDESGTHWSRESLLLRGFVTEIDQQTKLGPDGAPTLIHVRGHVPEGDAGEMYEVKHGAYTYMSPVDRGSG